MSLASLQSFVAAVSADEGLTHRLRSATHLDDVLQLARDHGHEISKASLLKAQATALNSSPDHALEGINSWGDALLHCFGATDLD